MKWRHWVNAILGAWFIIAPWALGLSQYMTATWVSVIVGAVQVIVSVWAAMSVRVPDWRIWQDWVAGACGFWFLIHPFLGDFEEGPYYATIVPGLITLALSLWTLMENPSRAAE